MLRYKSQIMPILFSALLFVGCSSEDNYIKPSLNDVNCENLDQHYAQCDRFHFVTHQSSCRQRYTPKLFKCYGAKSAGF